MSELRKAAQQALEALELAQTDVHWELNSPMRKFLRKAKKSLHAALAQPEPVALQEVERLRAALRYEENRFSRIGTHGPDCWKWGPSHYECALRRINND